MEFSRQEYWSGLPLHSPGDLPDPGIEPVSPASVALAGGFSTTQLPGKPVYVCIYIRLSAKELILLNCGVGEDS